MNRHTVLTLLFVLLQGAFFEAGCKKDETPAAPPPSPPNENAPKVLITYPPANSKGPYENFISVQVTFTRPMDEGTVQSAISLTDPAGEAFVRPGYISHTDPWSYSIPLLDKSDNLFRSWRVGNTYTLRISGAAKGTDGLALDPPFKMTFQPEPMFRVRQVVPSPDTTNVMLGRSGSYPKISFNGALTQSILPYVEISPPMPGSWSIVKGDATAGFDSSALLFTPVRYANATRYTITVKKGASEKRGATLLNDTSFSFTTIPFQVYETTPADAQTEVSLVFGRFDVTFTNLLDSNSVQNALLIEPYMNGKYFISGSTVSFMADSGFAAYTPYTVQVAQTVTSAYGVSLASPYQFGFKTEGFRMISADPPSGTAGVGTGKPIALTFRFNVEIDRSTVEQAFHIEPPVGGYFSFCEFSNCNDTWFSYIGRLEPGVPYYIQIRTGLHSKRGDPLTRDFWVSYP